MPQAFLHNGSALTALGKPDDAVGSYALDVNSKQTVVGYSTYTVGSDTVERAFRSSGNAGSFTLLGTVSASLNFPSTTSSRAIAVNTRGDILVRAGAAGSYQAWVLPDGAAAVNLGVPTGYKSPNPLSITDAGVVLAEVEAQNDSARRLALYTPAAGSTPAAWTLLADASTAWPWFRGGRVNEFGLVVGSARATERGADTAVIHSAGKWFQLNDLVPADSGWVLGSTTPA